LDTENKIKISDLDALLSTEDLHYKW